MHRLPLMEQPNTFGCCFPIRGGKVIVQLGGVPCDLTLEEVEQISSMVQMLLKINAIGKELHSSSCDDAILIESTSHQ